MAVERLPLYIGSAIVYCDVMWAYRVAPYDTGRNSAYAMILSSNIENHSLFYILYLISIWSVYDLSEVSEEAKLLCWINERFDDENEAVKAVRFRFAKVASDLIARKWSAWHSEAGRNYALAVTHLEDACMRAIKGLYS